MKFEYLDFANQKMSCIYNPIVNVESTSENDYLHPHCHQFQGLKKEECNQNIKVSGYGHFSNCFLSTEALTYCQKIAENEKIDLSEVKNIEFIEYYSTGAGGAGGGAHMWYGLIQFKNGNIIQHTEEEHFGLVPILW